MELADNGGQWSNENILQLLDQYKEERCLWDPRRRDYKNRTAHKAAWERILGKLPFHTTIDEAKKKRNSLMGYYRIHLNRYKNTHSISGGRSVYQTTWFAFDVMHSFLSPIYGPRKKKTTMPMGPASTTSNDVIQVEVKSEPRSESGESVILEDTFTNESTDFSIENHDDLQLKAALYPEVNVCEDSKPGQFNLEGTKDESLLVPKIAPSTDAKETVLTNNKVPIEKAIPHSQTVKRVSEECDCVNHPNQSVPNRTTLHSMDEYDHFGFMLASKLRKINGTPEREILMNSIQNLVFDTYMKCHRK